MSKVKPILIITFVCSSSLLFAQSTGSSVATYGLIALVLAIFLGAVYSVSESLFRVQAQRLGVEDAIENEPSFFSVKRNRKAGAEELKRLNAISSKKGFDLNLKGRPVSDEIHEKVANSFAVQPTNFKGIAPIPKMLVEVGAEVKAGDPLFYDKSHPDIMYVAPVSGEVAEIRRGAKRSISEVVILADKAASFKEFELPALNDPSAIKDFLKSSGFWPHIKQRPFDVVADPERTPRDVFISAYATGPLAPSAELVLDGNENAFQKGLEVLSKLTTGQVHLGLEASLYNPFNGFDFCQKHYFKGKHPMGNVGVHIHHIKPILSADDIVWTLSVQDVILLGNVFINKRYDASRLVALVGDEFTQPKYVRTALGANISDLLQDELANDNVRIISGDVLTGQEKGQDSFLNFFDNQLTAIAEGDYYEMFGWLIPQAPRPSLSRSYPGFLFPDMEYKADTNTHGEKRAFVVTGQYEEVLPMEIYPQHLFKAILTNDYEKMEGLGIFELSKEDVALCEFVCTSKQPLQEILEKGHDMIIAES